MTKAPRKRPKYAPSGAMPRFLAVLLVARMEGPKAKWKAADMGADEKARGIARVEKLQTKILKRIEGEGHGDRPKTVSSR